MAEISVGVGLAAAIGKIGASIVVFSIPCLLRSGGGKSVLVFSIIVFLAGGLVTYIFGKIVFKKSKTDDDDNLG